MKKKIIVFLVVLLSFATYAPVMAETNNVNTTTIDGETVTTEIIQDDEYTRVVKSTDSTGTYTTQFNKETNEVKVYKNDELQSSTVITPKEPKPVTEPTYSKDSPSYVVGPNDGGGYTERDSDYWFDLYYRVNFYENDTKGWTISLSDAAFPSYVEDASNKGSLEGFRESVRTAKIKEETVGSLVGATIASAFAGYLASLTTGGISIIIGTLLAIGGSYAAALAGIEAYNANEDATYYYYELKY